MSGKIEINKDFKKVLDLLENTGKNIFITGKAGTGKSTLLRYFLDGAKKHAVVLAPTGVAAINVQGQTIHSFFHFGIDITPQKAAKMPVSKESLRLLYKSLDLIIIDEVSMVRADLLDCVDKFLRKHGPDKALPFGGVQMAFFGDLYQLPPVVSGADREIFKSHYESPYFFSSFALKNCGLEMIELEKIYRQKDDYFIEILNAIRNNSVAEQELDWLNRRVDFGFEPDRKEFYITLTSTNAQADEANARELAKLKERESVYHGLIQGNFDLKNLPTKEDLALKPGAQIMLLNNDSAGRWHNGSIGIIKKIKKPAGGEADEIRVLLNDGSLVNVSPNTWEMYNYYYDKTSKQIESEPVGSFSQYPIRLAWAVTIHKSQGKTFERVIIDVGRGTFAQGQMYVALSRCTSLEGIILRKPVQLNHIYVDWRIVKFITGFQYKKSEQDLPLADKIQIIRQAIKENHKLRITYLKSNDTKSKRLIKPLEAGEMYYQDRKFLGVSGFCYERKENRCFRVDRILALEVIA